MAEEKLTTMANLGEIKSIDFVNKFSKNINDLLTLLGVTRRQELTSDLKIQTYKWTADVNATNPAEGEDIPLSQMVRAKAQAYEVAWFKKRRSVSAEAIARHGASVAITEADTRLMREIQNGIKEQFFTFLKANPTKNKGKGLQGALAQAWAKIATFNEFEGSPIVTFVNPVDAAAYLGDAGVGADASNVFGMTLLKNFLGMQNVIVMNGVPEGKIYTTAIENLVFANLNVASGDLGGLFADFTDETGLIAVARDRALKNLTFESVFFGANVLFAEIPEGVVETTIEKPAAIELERATEEIRLLKGIPKSDQEQDDLLTLIVRDSFERMIAYVNRFSESPLEELPETVAYILRDVAVSRFNRLNSEGATADSEEGRSFTWEDGYLTDDNKAVLEGLAVKHRARGVSPCLA